MIILWCIAMNSNFLVDCTRVPEILIKLCIVVCSSARVLLICGSCLGYAAELVLLRCYVPIMGMNFECVHIHVYVRFNLQLYLFWNVCQTPACHAPGRAAMCHKVWHVRWIGKPVSECVLPN